MASKRNSPMVERLPLTQARVHLGAVIKRVRLNKARIVLEKDGIPVAAILDIDEFEDYLELQDPKVREHIRKSNEEYLAGKGRPAEGFLAELRGGTRTRAKRPQRQKA
ncbi:MAG: type II toxin-antitoxin system Phd/YefM family antitoxin [Deltaproteobacteria bacterium]|nr:type II toxin-antitoxin system Phd/YefM family antitoxin [Deltaproteobacteria bacterium]MBI3075569.1 type II toxin-antitoxin system Phd/YefM family antitoxin [Deltaproteobacteria bacterium]